jgi:hypothetical protein
LGLGLALRLERELGGAGVGGRLGHRLGWRRAGVSGVLGLERGLGRGLGRREVAFAGIGRWADHLRCGDRRRKQQQQDSPRSLHAPSWLDLRQRSALAAASLSGFL